MSDPNLPQLITRPLWFATAGLIAALFLVILWAVTAPLATTIRANGVLISETPTYQIQHQFGGKIDKVHVKLHSNVQQGQVLFSLNVESQKVTLDNLSKQSQVIKDENTIINQLLLGQIPDIVNQPLNDHYRTISQQNALEVKAIYFTKTAAFDQATATKLGHEILLERQNAIQARLDNLNSLFAKGIATSELVEQTTDQLLQVKGEISDSNINSLTLEQQIIQANIKSEKLKSDFRLFLQNKKHDNEMKLFDMSARIFALDDEISNAIIKSPILGTIVAIGFNTEQMYASRGETLAKLSKVLKKPVVQVTIPTQAIDQVYQGMKGELTILSLSQRNLPKVRIKLKSISPDALKDDQGMPIGYQAQADLLTADLNAIENSLGGKLRLSSDMPVSVALTGRSITFFNFLIAPFFEIFKSSLED